MLRLLREEQPDVLCLQETKTPVEKLPLEGLRALGYQHVVARGEKAYNGVAILSRLPLEDDPAPRLLHPRRRPPRRGPPALRRGGPQPLHPGRRRPARPGAQPKFAHKLDFLAELRAWFAATPPERAILVGDLNVAPREDDVWNHRRLLRIAPHAGRHRRRSRPGRRPRLRPTHARAPTRPRRSPTFRRHLRARPAGGARHEAHDHRARSEPARRRAARARIAACFASADHAEGSPPGSNAAPVVRRR